MHLQMAMMSITYRNPGTHVPCDKWRSVATRANNWLDRLKNGHLPAKFAWVLYRLQLWSSLKYGLGTLLAPIAQMGEVIKNFAFKALPFLGVNRNIRSEYCYTCTLPSAGLSCFCYPRNRLWQVARANLFLQHWGMPTPIDQSMELLQLEIECVGCPLNKPYEPMGPLSTHCWLKSFWEVVSKFKYCT